MHTPYAPPQVSSFAVMPPWLWEKDGPASRGDRFSAAAIDVIVAVLASMPGMIATVVMMVLGWNAVVLGCAILPLLMTAIYQAHLINVRGQTIGLKQYHLIMVRSDGSPLSFFDAFVLKKCGLITTRVFYSFRGPLLETFDAMKEYARV